MAQDQQEEEFLTVAEVAELLKLNQQTVRNWIDQGSMPAIRIGRRVRIKKSDLDRVLASGYQGPPELRDPGLGGPSAADFWGGEQVGTADPSSSSDAGSTVGRDDAGSTVGRDDAGSTVATDDTGSTAARDDAGSTIARDNAAPGEK